MSFDRTINAMIWIAVAGVIVALVLPVAMRAQPNPERFRNVMQVDSSYTAVWGYRNHYADSKVRMYLLQVDTTWHYEPLNDTARAEPNYELLVELYGFNMSRLVSDSAHSVGWCYCKGNQKRWCSVCGSRVR